MISKLLYTLQGGLQAILTHLRLLVVVVLLFFVPLLLLYVHQTLERTALENIETVDKQLINLLHTHLKASSQEALSNFEDVQEITNSQVSASRYSIEGEEYVLVDSSVEEPLAIDSFILSAAPANGEVYIFELLTYPTRSWLAVSRSTADDSLYVTAHDFSAADQVIQDRNREVIKLIALCLIVFVAIALWFLMQINWQKRYRSLQASLAEQQLLMGAVTHEFRSPLTAILGHLSFLRESNRLRSRDLDSLDKVEKSAERLRNLVNDFLEVSKLQTGKLDVKASAVPVAEVVSQVLVTLGSEAAKHEIVLRDGTKDSTIVLTTDRDRLTQILHNLVNNAIKYTEAGEVVIHYEKTPLELTIRVADTGTGISAADQKKLFQPFTRVGGVDKTDITGSGLGMWISRKLVETLGGSIGIESIKGIGTHVVVTFSMRKIAQKTREGIL